MRLGLLLLVFTFIQSYGNSSDLDAKISEAQVHANLDLLLKEKTLDGILEDTMSVDLKQNPGFEKRLPYLASWAVKQQLEFAEKSYKPVPDNPGISSGLAHSPGWRPFCEWWVKIDHKGALAFYRTLNPYDPVSGALSIAISQNDVRLNKDKYITRFFKNPERTSYHEAEILMPIVYQEKGEKVRETILGLLKKKNTKDRFQELIAYYYKEFWSDPNINQESLLNGYIDSGNFNSLETINCFLSGRTVRAERVLEWFQRKAPSVIGTRYETSFLRVYTEFLSNKERTILNADKFFKPFHSLAITRGLAFKDSRKVIGYWEKLD